MEPFDDSVALRRVHSCHVVDTILLAEAPESLLTNWGPLSETRTPGNLFLLNISVKCLTITCAVVDFKGTTSGHLVAISM